MVKQKTHNQESRGSEYEGGQTILEVRSPQFRRGDTVGKKQYFSAVRPNDKNIFLLLI